MAGGYQLWAPRSPLDEALRWLRGAPPPAPQAAAISAHPFRGACLPPLAAAAGGLRGRAAAAAGREAAGPRRRFRAAGDGAAAALERLAAGVGALGLLPGGGPAAAGAWRAAGDRGPTGRRHVPQDAARHPVAVRRLQEVCLRPAALAMRALGTLGISRGVTRVRLGWTLQGVGCLGTILKPHCTEHSMKPYLLRPVPRLPARMAPQGKLAEEARGSECNSMKLVDSGTSYVKEMKTCTPHQRL